jgi:hypothetical protein
MKLWNEIIRWLIGAVREIASFVALGDGLTGDEGVTNDNVDRNIAKDDYEHDLSIIDNVDHVVPFLKKNQDE